MRQIAKSGEGGHSLAIISIIVGAVMQFCWCGLVIASSGG